MHEFMPIFQMMIILTLTFAVGRMTSSLLRQHVVTFAKNLKVKPAQYSFLIHLIVAAIYIFGVGLSLYVLPTFQKLSLSILASSGVAAVILGFAAQQALGNLVSGIFITIFRPFSVEDRIKIPGKLVNGIVEEITLRHTVIRTFENKRVVIPNSVISTEIIENANMRQQKVCEFIEIGISYDSDVDLAMTIMQEEGLAHPAHIDWRTVKDKKAGEQEVPVRVIGFGDSSVNLRAWVWFPDPATGFVGACDLRKSIKSRFDREGVEIPFPHRTLVYKNAPRYQEEKHGV